MAAMELSLRRYVLLSLLAVVGIMIVVFTVMSAKQFLDGMDGMLRGTMISIARDSSVNAAHPVKALNFTIAADWQDLPKQTRQRFNPSQLVPFRLYKDIKRHSIFHRPDEAHFVMLVDFEEQQPVYVSQSFTPREPGDEPPFRMTREAWLLIIGLMVLLAFTALVLFMIRTIANPVERLQKWADGVGKGGELTPPPGFRYTELNTLASLFYQGMLSVKQSVRREQEFVRHASHELRTPIAVIRSSMELIARVRKEAPADKLSKPLKRIDNASHTMVDLTETLLWLTKADKGSLTTSVIQLDEQIGKVTEELTYLLEGKEIALTVETQPYKITQNATALRIVLGNLIRNAFQHTQNGKVTIVQEADKVTITNVEHRHDDFVSNKEELGFGLGLKMVNDLSAFLGWSYEYGKGDDGKYTVVIKVS